MRRNQWLALTGICVALIVIIVASQTFRQPDPGQLASPSANIDQGDAPLKGTGSQTARAHPEKPDSTRINVPLKYQFEDQRWVDAVDDREQLMAKYTPDQRAAITSFYTGYGQGVTTGGQYNFSDVFSFHSREQLEWLVDQGYPTPGDILAATTLATPELRDQAEAGNFKARVFYLARIQGSQDDVSKASSIREIIKKGSDTLRLASDVLTEGSPFGAYAYAKYSAGEGSKGLAIAGFAYAGILGDTRQDFLTSYVNSNPDISPGEVAAGFRVVLSTSVQNPSLQNLKTLVRRPRFQIYPPEP